MFDLEHEVAKWRREMEATGLAPEILNELEEHLREDVERYVRGISVPEAFQNALRRMGKPHALKDEFDLISQPGVMRTLRRHKWKVLLCSAAGLLAAIGLSILRPAHFQSETKLFVRYAGATANISPDERAEVMRQEAAILTSFDLLRHVAVAIGPEKIMYEAGGDEDPIRAALVIHRGLRVEVPANSGVILVTFRHPDSSILQPVLRELIQSFLRQSAELERSTFVRTDAVRKVTNIALIQSPSAPFLDFPASYRIMTMAIIAAGVLTGLAWVLVARRAEVRLKLAG
jgi:hypothetical protein